MATGKLIAVANMKGGVGKTTTVVTLAESLLAEDPTRQVLVVDLDPQASASVTIAGDDALHALIRDGLTLQDHLESRLLDADREARLANNIRSGLNNTWHLNERLDLHLLPCGPNLRVVEKKVVYRIAEAHGGYSAYEGRVKRLFAEDFLPLKTAYDYIVFDCPPGISTLAEVAIRASDVVIMPTIPDRISVYGLSAFIQTVWDPNSRDRPIKPHVLIARAQNIRKHRDIIKALQEEASEPDCAFHLFKTGLPQLVSFANALDVDHERPVSYRSRYPDDVSGPMRALTREVMEACHGV